MASDEDKKQNVNLGKVCEDLFYSGQECFKGKIGIKNLECALTMPEKEFVETFEEENNLNISNKDNEPEMSM